MTWADAVGQADHLPSVTELPNHLLGWPSLQDLPLICSIQLCTNDAPALAPAARASLRPCCPALRATSAPSSPSLAAAFFQLPHHASPPREQICTKSQSLGLGIHAATDILGQQQSGVTPELDSACIMQHSHAVVAWHLRLEVA